jgi:hypothetical protein
MTMVLHTGTNGWASPYGPTKGRWLQEEFDDLGRDRHNGEAISVDRAHAADAARVREWGDETDYDTLGFGGCCRERPSPFPDPYDLIHHDGEK